MASELRDKLHSDLCEFRKVHRARQRDTFRCGLSEEEINEAEILKICNRIKRRKHADEDDLMRLSNGFLWSHSNISAFLKTQGAVNVLVKELIGSSGRKLLLTTETFCNLSLGDSGSCAKVSKLISSYLLTMITSVNSAVAQTSLWILYNLMAESEKSQEIFFAGRVDLKLLTILEGNFDPELKLEATKCLSPVVASTLFPGGEEELNRILEMALENFNGESSRLIYEILYRLKFNLIDPGRIERIIRQLISQLDQNEDEVAAQQLYAIRIFGNLATIPNASSIVLRTIQGDSETFIRAFNNLLQSENVIFKETLWSLGNILKISQHQSTSGDEFIETIVKRLVVPRKPDYEFRCYADKVEKMDN